MVGTCSRLLMSLAATASGPLLCHLDASRDVRMWVVAGIYVLQGISTMTLFIEQEALVLALAPEDRRPTFIGFLNTLSFPLFLGCPILGGVLANACGYAVAFGAMLIFNLGGIVVAAALGRAKQEAWLAAAAQSDTGRTVTEK
jgi:MFS family permease